MQNNIHQSSEEIRKAFLVFLLAMYNGKVGDSATMEITLTKEEGGMNSTIRVSDEMVSERIFKIEAKFKNEYEENKVQED